MMTTMTLTFDDQSQEIVEALKTIASNFKGVTLEIEKTESKEEVLESFRTAVRDIRNGEMMRDAVSSEAFFREFANG
jgi:DNA primase large subunit